MAEEHVDDTSIDNSFLLSSEEVYESYCQSCTNVGKTIPAQGYCESCEEYFCGTCCQEHKKFNVTKKHVIKHKDEVTYKKRTKQSKQMYNFVDKCLSHTDENIKFLCQNCDTLGCSVCMTTCHRACALVSYIPDILQTQAVEKEIREVKQTIERVLEAVSEDKLVLKESKTVVNTYKTCALKQLEKERANINRFLDSLEHKFETQTAIVEEEDISNISEAEQIFDTVYQDMKMIQSEVLLAEGGHTVNKFIATKTAKRAITAAQKQADIAWKRTRPRRYTFVASSQNMRMIQKLDKLGSLIFTKNRARKATFHGNINIAVEENVHKERSKGCSVKGIEILSESQLALTDSYNYCVTLVSIAQNRPLHSTKLPSWPFGITKIKEDKIAITLPVLKQINVIDIAKDNTMTCGKVIKRDKICGGLVYFRCTLFVTYSNSQTKLEILDLSGNVLKVFTNDIKGQTLFGKPYYISLCAQLDLLCVSDVETNYVTYLNQEGDVKAVYCNKKLIAAVRDIAIDDDGVLFVCAYNADKVFQLIDDGNKAYQLLDSETGLKFPQALAYCPKTRRLYVGLEDGFNVKVFDILF